jgi:transcriptional regulator with PAS, ATPase and Fis domain
MTLFHSYPFPGNVRELKNLVKKAVIMGEDPSLDAFIERALETGAGASGLAGGKKGPRKHLSDELIALEKSIIKHALQRCKSTRELAVDLGVSQPTAVRKLKKHNLSMCDSLTNQI